MIYYYLIATVLVFLGSRKILRPRQSPLANPLLVSILFFIGLFSFTPLNYQDYATANQPFIWLLEPTVVVIAISTCLSVALLLTDDKVLLLSLLPKSVTSPIAMAVANETGGLPSLSAAVVIAVGLLGALGGFSLLKLCKITNPQAQGLAMGCSAHAIGTAKAMEVGNEQGAFSSLALVISGILTAVFAWLISIMTTM